MRGRAPASGEEEERGAARAGAGVRPVARIPRGRGIGRRAVRVALGGLLAVVLLGVLSDAGAAPGAADPAGERAARVAKLAALEAADLRRLAEWGDKNGLAGTAALDWERALSLDPKDEATHKRLGFVRKGPAWVRDDATAALVRAATDAKPEQREAYAARREAEVVRPATARLREHAVWCRQAGLGTAADEALEQVVRRDPDDALSRLALGQVLDPFEGWVPRAIRGRRVADAAAEREVRRLRSLVGEPVAVDEVPARSTVVDAPLTSWRLREWRLETDLDDDAASLVLATVDLGARWFRDRFGLGAGEPVLPGEAVFVVLSTNERYLRAVDGEPGISAGLKAFARNLSALPLPHRADRGPWTVLVERPDGASAADACLHYAIHLLMQARFRVEAEEAWLYEGLAVYAVLRLFGTNQHWCVKQEQTSARPLDPMATPPPEWSTDVLAMVFRREDEPLRRLVGASLNELDGPMLLKAWSLLRLLFEEHPTEGVAFLEAKGRGLGTEAAFRAATGLGLDEVDAAWRLAVLETEGE